MSAFKRPKPNDGHVMTSRRVLPIRQSLIDAIAGPNKRAEPVKLCADGMAKRRGRPAAKLTDAELLYVRALYEFGTLKPAAIASIVGCDIKDVRVALTYNNRTHLLPTPADVFGPAGAASKPARG